MKLEFKGVPELNAALAAVPAKAKALVAFRLKTDLMDLEQKAAELAPKELGDLEGSSNSGAAPTATGIEGFVSFDTEYATRQHEEMEWKHTPGRQAKYLEQPLNENVKRYVDNIGKVLKGGL